MDALLRLTLGVGKSLELRRGLAKPVRRTLGGEGLRIIVSDRYLGVGVSATGSTMEALYARVDETTATIATLRQTGALVRGIDMQVAVQMHTNSCSQGGSMVASSSLCLQRVQKR